MPHMVVLHIAGEESVAGEVEELPKLTDTIIIVHNPRRRDGKELHYLDNNTVTVIWPMARVGFIEVLGSEEHEEIISFVRE